MTTLTQVDRRATPAELAAARRRVMKRNGGPGVEVAAQRIGVGVGFLSDALRGMTVRSLKISELRRMMDASSEGDAGAVPAKEAAA